MPSTFLGSLRSTLLLGLFVVATAFGQSSVASHAAPAAQQPSAQAIANYARLPLSFEPNRGQTSGDVQWLSRGSDFTLFLTGHDAVLEMSRVSAKAGAPGEKPLAPTIQSSALRMNLIGAQNPKETAGEDAQKSRANYFTGKYPSRWQHDVPMYGKVRLAQVYPGIDLVYYGTHGQLEYDFIVAPGADASAIRLSLEGTDPRLNANGDLILPVHGTSDEVRFNKPVVYQMNAGVREPVDAAFTIAANHQVSFALGAYDRTRELIIDPQLLFLGAYGTGNQQTVAQSMTVDSVGEIMLTGITNDLALPVTSGALQSSCGTYGPAPAAQRCGVSTPGSAFVSKISADGTTLVYSTYLHGSAGYEYGGAIATDAAGDAYVLGATASNDFPITSDAIQKYCRPQYPTIGFSNPPVFGPLGSYCDGYFNGGGTEYTVVPWTLFITKLSPNGSQILYSTFFGGTQEDDPIAIALDSGGAIYFASHIHGPGRALDYYPNNGNVPFPFTSTAFQQYAPADGNGIFDGGTLTKLSADGHTVLYSTLLTAQSPNSPASSVPTALAVGQNGVVILGGYTSSSSFPTTAGSFDPSCPLGGGTNPNCQTNYGFVSAFDTTKAGAASLVWSTYVGGTTAPGSNIPQDEVLAVAVDSSNNAYASGYTYDANFPTTTGAYQTTCLQRNGACSATFLTKFAAANGSALWSTYFGSTNVVYGVGVTGTGIVLDSKGRVNLYGSTSIGSYGIGGTMPVVNPIEAANNNGNSLFLTTFSPDGANLIFSTQIHNTNSCCVLGLTSIQQGLAIDAAGNLYFGAYGADSGQFSLTNGTYDTASAGGFNRTFFGKISPVLQPTSTTLTAAPATTITGQSVTFTATVAGTMQTTPAPSGSVKLTNTATIPATTLGTIQLGGTGTGTFSTSSLAAGTYTVVGTYSADTTYDVSTSAAATVVVNTPATATIALTVPATATVGTSVTFTAKLTGTSGTPTGTVYFMDGTTMLGSQVLSGGSASYSTSSLTVGTHSISISYSGDNVFGAATSTAQTLTVSLAASTVALTVPATALVGASVTMSATVTGTGGTPAGTVTFKDGTTTLSTQTLAGGAASYSTSSLAAGAHSITASYSGSGLFAAATSSAQTLTVSLATPTVSLTVPATALTGASVTMSTTVAGTGGMPTGTVTFKDGTTTLSTQTLASGAASYSTSSLTAGTHSITASYSGDGLFAAATSAAQTITVSVPPNISFVANPTTLTVTHGSSGTITFTGTPVGGFAGTLTFACGTLPASASCSFSPSSLTFTSASSATQSTTLTISTVSTVALLEGAPGRDVDAAIFAALLLLPFGFNRRIRKLYRGSPLSAIVLCGALLGSVAVLGLTGCGSSGSFGPTQTTTPAGSYSVPVVITNNGATTTVTVQLTVQ
jgi:hypothetical protein